MTGDDDVLAETLDDDTDEAENIDCNELLPEELDPPVRFCLI